MILALGLLFHELSSFSLVSIHIHSPKLPRNAPWHAPSPHPFVNTGILLQDSVIPVQAMVVSLSSVRPAIELHERVDEGLSRNLKLFFGTPLNDPFLICAEQRREGVVPDRHTFFEARWARQKLIRLMRQSTDPPPSAESSNSLCREPNHFWNYSVKTAARKPQR